MIITKSLISHFYPGVNDLTTAQIVDTLELSGIEAECAEEIKLPTKLTYGYVEECELLKFEDSKKDLYLTKVNIGSETLSIVCGAHNIAKDLKVVVAQVGCEFPSSKFTIVERKLRGYLSQGMICSLDEIYGCKLNKSTPGLGILSLGDAWDHTKPFDPSDLDLQDSVFNLSIPVNRRDLNTAWSIAQEIQKNLKIERQDYVPQITLDDLTTWKFKKSIYPHISTTEDFTDTQSILTLYLYLAFGVAVKIDNNTITSIDYKLPQFPLAPYFLEVLLKNFVDQLMSATHKVSQNNQTQATTPKHFSLDWTHLSKLFGQETNIAAHTKDTLSKASFCFKDSGTNPDSRSEVTPPPWRTDLVSQNSFINELAILYPISNLKELERPIVLNTKTNNSEHKFLSQLRDYCFSLGFVECNTENKTLLATPKLTYGDKLTPGSTESQWFQESMENTNDIFINNQKYQNCLYPIFEIKKISTSINQYFWKITLASPSYNEKSIFKTTKNFGLNNTYLTYDKNDLVAIINRFFAQFSFTTKDVSIITSHSPQIARLFKENQQPELTQNPEYTWDYLHFDIRPNNLPQKVLKTYKHTSLLPISYKDISVEIGNNWFHDHNISDLIDAVASIKHCINCQLIECYKKDITTSYLFRCSLQSKTDTLTSKQIQQFLSDVSELFQTSDLKLR